MRASETSTPPASALSMKTSTHMQADFRTFDDVPTCSEIFGNFLQSDLLVGVFHFEICVAHFFLDAKTGFSTL